MKARRGNGLGRMRAEYRFDYSKAERGRYYKRLLKEGSNVVVLDRDVAKKFPDSASVNKALRAVLKKKRPRRAATHAARSREKPRAGYAASGVSSASSFSTSWCSAGLL